MEANVYPHSCMHLKKNCEVCQFAIPFAGTTVAITYLKLCSFLQYYLEQVALLQDLTMLPAALASSHAMSHASICSGSLQICIARYPLQHVCCNDPSTIRTPSPPQAMMQLGRTLQSMQVALHL